MLVRDGKEVKGRWRYVFKVHWYSEGARGIDAALLPLTVTVVLHLPFTYYVMEFKRRTRHEMNAKYSHPDEYIDDGLSKCCNKAMGTYPSPFRDLHVDGEHPRERDKARAILELRMYALSAAIREKENWHQKRLDETIIKKWKEELLEQQEDLPRERRLTADMVWLHLQRANSNISECSSRLIMYSMNLRVTPELLTKTTDSSWAASNAYGYRIVSLKMISELPCLMQPELWRMIGIRETTRFV